MTSSRPYKAAFSPNEALAMIREGAGSKFDPNLVANFLLIHDTLRQQLDALGGDDSSAS